MRSTQQRTARPLSQERQAHATRASLNSQNTNNSQTSSGLAGADPSAFPCDGLCNATPIRHGTGFAVINVTIYSEFSVPVSAPVCKGNCGTETSYIVAVSYLITGFGAESRGIPPYFSMTQQKNDMRQWHVHRAIHFGSWRPARRARDLREMNLPMAIPIAPRTAPATGIAAIKTMTNINSSISGMARRWLAGVKPAESGTGIGTSQARGGATAGATRRRSSTPDPEFKLGRQVLLGKAV